MAPPPALRAVGSHSACPRQQERKSLEAHARKAGASAIDRALSSRMRANSAFLQRRWDQTGFALAQRAPRCNAVAGFG